MYDKKDGKMNIYKTPNLKEILKPVWAHKPGFGMSKEKGKRVYLKQDILEQGTTPKDPRLLKKLGIKKGDKILSIAGYYATWASALKKAGAKVDYSDVSKPIVNWVKKNVKTKFGKIILSNYEKIPKKPLEYDWTFTYEACGGGRGLPIAYLRSLLNKKGGILMLCADKRHLISNKAKLRRYPKIVKTLANTYGAKFKVERKRINARKKKGGFKRIEYIVCSILTNKKARELAGKDINALFSNKFSKDNLMRLNKFSKVIADESIKEIKFK